jgi:mRNA-degrading endonuclease RelE of RelBE toxin-antitoxin system
MKKNYELVFDDAILKQLKQTSKNNSLKTLLSKIFDKIEEIGPRAGSLIDPKLFIYEIKMKHPPIRIYYKHNKTTNEIYLFEYEFKTSEKKQDKTIKKIRKKILKS